MSRDTFRLKIELDPAPEDRVLLQQWPRKPLLPDLATVAAGWIALEIGGRPILYHKGQLVDPPAVAQGDPLTSRAARIGDYVLVFLQRLIDAIHHLADGQPHEAGFGDNPARLVLHKTEHGIDVAYREARGGEDIARATVAESAFLSTVRAAASRYVEEVQTLNAALRDHPDLAALHAALRRL